MKAMVVDPVAPTIYAHTTQTGQNGASIGERAKDEFIDELRTLGIYAYQGVHQSISRLLEKWVPEIHDPVGGQTFNGLDLFIDNHASSKVGRCRWFSVGGKKN